LSFEEARPVILERVQRDRRQAAEAEWHARLRSQARIDILDAALAGAQPIEIPGVVNALPGRPASPTAVARPSH
jgi:hypothetical protein